MQKLSSQAKGGTLGANKAKEKEWTQLSIAQSSDKTEIVSLSTCMVV